MAENWDEYWKDETIKSKILTFMRVHYFADIPFHHLGDIKGKRILEAGCGSSETLVRMAKKAKKVVGIDISKNSISVSRAKFERNDIPKDRYSLVLGDIRKMNFTDNTFDITFNSGVIEHFDDDKINNTPLEEMIRVTKKGGKIVILVPSAYSVFYLYYLLSRIPGLNRIFIAEPHRFYSFRLMRNQLNGLNINYKIKLCFRSLFIYMVAEITK